MNLPINLDEAIVWLENHVELGDQKEIKDIEQFELHHTLGRFIRNQLRLWDNDTELAQWFFHHGIWHADDMSAIIIGAAIAKIRGTAFDLENKVKYYKDYWSASGVLPW